MAARATALALAALLVLAGCTSLGPAPPEDPRRELTDVPFFPQTAYQCGPAALATVLGATGIDTTPEALAPLVYIPGRKGSLQVEMLAAARRHGRVAVVLAPEFADLRTELDAGRPVLVLQNLGALGIRRWHFAVVVGYDAERDALILRSGTRRRHVESRPLFLRTWKAGGNWAAVVTPAQEPPATTTGAQFIRSLAEAERGLGAGQLEAGHRAALARWPDEPLVLLANGNDAHARGELNAAIGHYRKLLAVDPVNVAGRNNLASALLDAGCPALALAEAQQAVGSLSPGDPLEAAVRETLEAAKAAASGNSTARCTAVPL